MSLPIGLRALRHPDFRRFFAAQFVAQTGSWMQTVAQSWLVLQLTPSPFKLGLIGSLQFAPILLFSIASGALADRLPKRRLLMCTQTALGCLALILAALVASGRVEYWHVAVLAFISGLVNVRRYAVRPPEIRLMLGLLFLVSICVFNFTVYVPLVVRTVLHLGAEGFGLLMACLGVGAVTGALTVGVLGARQPPTAMLFSTAALACGGLLALSTARVFWFAAVAVFLTGLFGVVLVASCNTAMQLAAPDELRGRVMSLYTLVWGGAFPVGAFIVGSISDHWGVGRALLVNGT